MSEGRGEIEVLLMGTGTSAGVPMIGCRCDVCTSQDPRDHRNRPGALVRRPDERYRVCGVLWRPRRSAGACDRPL